jgi:hypothetical protein
LSDFVGKKGRFAAFFHERLAKIGEIRHVKESGINHKKQPLNF